MRSLDLRAERYHALSQSLKSKLGQPTAPCAEAQASFSPTINQETATLPLHLPSASCYLCLPQISSPAKDAHIPTLLHVAPRSRGLRGICAAWQRAG